VKLRKKAGDKFQGFNEVAKAYEQVKLKLETSNSPSTLRQNASLDMERSGGSAQSDGGGGYSSSIHLNYINVLQEEVMLRYYQKQNEND
jgi:hypothetical protein